MRRYDFCSLVQKVIAPTLMAAELNELHLHKELMQGGKRQGKGGGRRKKRGEEETFHQFLTHRWFATVNQNHALREMVYRFVKDVISPLLWEESEREAHEDSEVFYQARPTLRMHMPGQPSCVARHTDYIYHRQPTETNVWLPLTAVGGSNSLWCESKPGKGDFSAFEVGSFGTAVLFWGNQCEHYSMPNVSSSTRVSLDLRVIRSDLFVKEYIAPENEVRYGSKAKPLIRVGTGYTSTTREAEWLAARKSNLRKHAQERHTRK